MGPLLITILVPLAERPPVRRALATGPAGLLATGLAASGAIAIAQPDLVVTLIHGGALGPLSDILMPGRSNWPVDGYLVQWDAPVRIVGWLTLAPAVGVVARSSVVRPQRVAGGLLMLLGLVSTGLLRPMGLPEAGLFVGLSELGGAVLLLGRSQAIAGGAGANAGRVEGKWLAVAALVAGIGAYGFGHDTGPVNAMPGASTLGAIALVFLVAVAARPPIRMARQRLVLVTTGALVCVTLVGIANVREAPYRSEPIRVQTAETPFGPHGAVLRVDPALENYLHDLVESAEAAGWIRGHRLFGLHATWSAGITYALGGEAPPSLQQAVGSGPRGLERLTFNLVMDDLAGWEDAWLILPDFALQPEDGIETEELDAVRLGLVLFGERVGTVWPRDYQLVWTAPENSPRAPTTRISLWRPRSQ